MLKYRVGAPTPAMGPRRLNPEGAGGLRSHTLSLLLAVALLRLVVVPSLSPARPLRATHCTPSTGLYIRSERSRLG